ncbi:transmembrane channel-like protein 3 [Watersipora subatra]|uniref:transmembrane channel-like protein 3 n=1 Tax=Watersipora subatra TaxID=2589382 RepID=UPI00355AF831
MRKKMVMLKEARSYTAKFEGKLSKSGGHDRVAQLKATYSKISRELSNFASLLVPWEGRIKHIESYFGGVVASYFTFLRWIFWTNIVQAVIIGGVIIVPEVLFGPDWGSVDYKTVPVNETEGAAYLKTSWDFDGYLKYSPLFYGYYSSTEQFSSGYSMPLAYLIANLVAFSYNFIAILRQIAINAKDKKASDKDDNFTFSWKTFASWDYMIGNSETAKNKFLSITVSIHESITEQKEAKKKVGKKLLFFRVIANLLVLMVLASSTYAIYLTVQRSQKFEKRIKDEGPNSVNAWERNEVSIVMSLATALFPMLFDLIAKMEDYHPRVALQKSLYRILILYLLNLYTLYIALYWKIENIQESVVEANATYYSQFNLSETIFCNQRDRNGDYKLLYSNDTMASNTTCVPQFTAETTCWETMVGQELFKLTVFDMVTTIGLIYVIEFFRALFIKIVNACWCWDLERNFPGYATFSLAENLLHLVYNQGMIWMGTLFAPGLPAFNLIKLLAIFYVRAWAVMVCNVPEERIFKAGSDNFYLLILLFMLYVVMIPVAFAMVTISTSTICGPFRDVEFMYYALTEWMEEVLPGSVNQVLDYIASPGALIPIFILLFLVLNYLKSSNDALKGSVADLKKQLKYERTEGKKKVFSMADSDGKSKQRKDKDKNAKARTSVTALQALHRMGGLKDNRSLSLIEVSEPGGHRKDQPENKTRSARNIRKGTSSLLALRALHRMGAFTNAKTSNPS